MVSETSPPPVGEFWFLVLELEQLQEEPLILSHTCSQSHTTEGKETEIKQGRMAEGSGGGGGVYM